METTVHVTYWQCPPEDDMIKDLNYICMCCIGICFFKCVDLIQNISVSVLKQVLFIAKDRVG